MNLFSRNLAVWVIIIVLLVALYSVLGENAAHKSDSEIAYSDFIAEIEGSNVSNVVIQGHRITGHYKDSQQEFFTRTPEADPGLIPLLRNSGVHFKVEESRRYLNSSSDCMILCWECHTATY